MNNSVFDYYIFIKSRLKWLIIIPMLCGIIGVLYATFHDHKYVGELTFVSNSDNNSSPYSILMQQVGIDVSSTNNAFEGDNLVEFLKTRFLIEQTLLTPVMIKNKRQLLVDYYLQISKLKDKWNTPGGTLEGIEFSQDRSKFSLLQDSALKLVYQQIAPILSVSKPDKKLSIVSISLTGEDPYWIKYFTEALIDNATKTYTKSKTAKLQENVSILQAKVDSINNRVSGNLSSIATTEDVNVNPSKRTSQIPIQKQQISLQVNNAILAELIKNLELAKIQLNKETPFIQVLDHPILPLDDKKPSRLISGIIGAFAGGVLIVLFIVGQIQFIKLKSKLFSNKAIEKVF